MDAVSTHKAIEALFNRFHGIAGFDQYPNLNHRAGFTVVAGGFKAGRDDDAGRVFMEYKSVHWRPPIDSMRATSAIIRTKASAATAPCQWEGIRGFFMI
jgi:hypothetical protein